MWTIRACLISLESVVLVWAALLWLVWPWLFSWADVVVQKIPMGWAASLLGTIAFAMSTMAVKVLFPKTDHDYLQAWPQYPQLRATVCAALVLGAVGAAAVLVGVAGVAALPPGLGSCLVAAGAIVLFIDIVSMFEASLRMRSVICGGN